MLIMPSSINANGLTPCPAVCSSLRSTSHLTYPMAKPMPGGLPMAVISNGMGGTFVVSSTVLKSVRGA